MNTIMKIVGLGLVVVTVLAVVLVGMASWITLGQGWALIIIDVDTHSISDPTLGPAGGFLMNGLKRGIGLQQAIAIYYETDKVEMWTTWKSTGVDTWIEDQRGEYPAITTLSKDGLPIEVDILVRWSIDSTQIRELYKKYPNLNWKEITINSIIREKVRDAVSAFSVIEIIENRQTVTTAISDKVIGGLKEDPLLASAVKNLVIDLRNIDPSVEFINAIERKLAAEQAKIQAQFEYESTLTRARAEAEAKIIVANGTRTAIEQIITLTGEQNSTRIAELYLTLEAYKVIAPNTKNFVVITGQGTPIVYPIPTNSTTP